MALVALTVPSSSPPSAVPNKVHLPLFASSGLATQHFPASSGLAAALPLLPIFLFSIQPHYGCPFTPMKHIIPLLLSLLLLVSAPLEAQTLRNANNATIGKVESNGTIRNANNATIGKVESDGTIRNSNNARIGKIDSDGIIRNANNATIGKVESDGTVRNANNATIGKVQSDGTVRNANNATIGKAEGVDRKIAAVLFFMHLLE